MPELYQDPIVIEATISVTLTENSRDRSPLDHEARLSRARDAVNSTLTAVIDRGNLAGPMEEIEGWSLNMGAAEEPEDHDSQEMVAACLNGIADSPSMLDGVVELLDQETIDAFLGAVERVRLSREREGQIRP